MLDCLIDWVGIRGCGTVDPLSGCIVNSLPGMSSELIDKIANADQQSFAGVWADVQDNAIRQIELNINSEFKKRYRILNVAQSCDLLRVIDTVANQTPMAANYRGFTIELSYPISPQLKYVASSFQVISVQTLAIYIPVALTSDLVIKVFDLQTGLVLETITTPFATLTTGWNVIEVNSRYVAPRIFIGYDATEIDSVYQDISQDFIYGGWVNYMWNWNSCEAMVRGGSTSSLLANVVDADCTRGFNIFGLSGIFSVQCKYDGLVCNNKDSFTTPLQYLMAAHLMMMCMGTNRKNLYTTTDREIMKKLGDKYLADYHEALALAIDGIDLNTEDTCLECNQSVQIHQQHP